MLLLLCLVLKNATPAQPLDLLTLENLTRAALCIHNLWSKITHNRIWNSVKQRSLAPQSVWVHGQLILQGANCREYLWSVTVWGLLHRTQLHRWLGRPLWRIERFFPSTHSVMLQIRHVVQLLDKYIYINILYIYSVSAQGRYFFTPHLKANSCSFCRNFHFHENLYNFQYLLMCFQ